MSGSGQTDPKTGAKFLRLQVSVKPRLKEGHMGSAVRPFIKDAVFDPEATHALAVAFDDICRDMNLADTASSAREIVAARIIDLAREGVVDPKILRERVLREAHALREML
jgi:hypothetical protein